MYVLSREDAEDIAQEAMEIKTFSVLDSTGYYLIYDKEDEDVAVDISKARDDDIEHFSIFVSFMHNEDDDHWDYTEHINKEELVEKLMEIADSVKGEN